MTPAELASLLPLLLCVCLVVSGSGWGLVGLGVWWMAFGVRRER